MQALHIKPFAGFSDGIGFQLGSQLDLANISFPVKKSSLD